jgi:glycosyltransferase involved in cell wall biosynthesis
MAMRILLLAPHPFYQERGTPIAVDLLLRVLSGRGATVDVLTYAEGAGRTYPGVTIHRIAPLLFTRGMRPGFSLKKLVADAQMLPRALAMARHARYDAVHAVEEAVFIAMLIRRRYRIPYVFDVDSCMPRQIASKKPFLRFLLPLMLRFERAAFRHALAVAPMCEDFAQSARAAGAEEIHILRDPSLLPDTQTAPAAFKDILNIQGLRFLYIGNLENYQGIDLLLCAFAGFKPETHNAHLIIVGGTPDDIQRYSRLAEHLGIAARTHFTGPKPVAEMPAIFDAADILVSPRTQGTNTPMKIYSYMDSGKPILATRLPTHTQVLNDTFALLVEPDAAAYAGGMRQLAENPELRAQLARQAKDVCREKYSFAAFSRAANTLYDAVEKGITSRRNACN